MARPEFARTSSLSRTFALVLASVVLLVTFLVAPLWNRAGAPRKMKRSPSGATS